MKLTDKHWTIKMKGDKRPTRLYQLGENYTGEAIMRRILANERPKVFIPAQSPPAKKYRLIGSFHTARKLTGYRALYFYFLYRMGVLPKSKKRPPCNPILWEDVRQIPACILVFKKGRKNTDVLFIDASKKNENGNFRYVKATNQNELAEKHIQDIAMAYQNRQDVDKFTHVASLDEIKGNDYNLNIPRYVDTFEDEPLVDIGQVNANIARLKTEIAEAEKQMDQYLKKLGL